MARGRSTKSSRWIRTSRLSINNYLFFYRQDPQRNANALSYAALLASSPPHKAPPALQNGAREFPAHSTNPSSVSVFLGPPTWRARALFHSKVDGFVPQTQHVNLGIARELPALSRSILAHQFNRGGNFGFRGPRSKFGWRPYAPSSLYKPYY
jgi:hypothetical protein